ncbi:hypothetical protein AB0F36_14380 [Streptomyces sp. NPDC029080]|uniref:hypothetical protein n=1 Tax=Streptomyces sp. NPDC029080 TaxID=3155017 RepID=UPI0033F0DDF5
MSDYATSRLPIVTANDGHAYLPACAVVALLRAIADTHRDLAGEPGCDLHAGAAAIDQEADYLECRAIQHTR